MVSTPSVLFAVSLYFGSCPAIVAYLEEQGIVPALVVDEGGAVVENVFPGVKEPCGLIGIAEKGMINAQYSVRSSGGHASAPKPHTPVGLVARACTRMENHPFKMHITAPVAAMFDTLGRYSTPLYRVIFANLWCFGWIIDLLGRMSGGEINKTEIVAALINQKSSFAEGIQFAQNVIEGTANILILTDKGHLIAARDKFGRIPVQIGKDQ